MKNVTTHTLMIAVAASALSLGAAYAQNPTQLTAEIPFSFRVGDQVNPAGTYTLSFLTSYTSAKMVKMVNAATGQTRVAIAIGPVYKTRDGSADAARLVFRCGDASSCALMQVWPGNDETGAQMNTPRRKSAELQHLAVIGLRTARAD